MRIRAVFVILAVAACCGCTVRVRPRVQTGYAQHPPERRIGKTCLIHVEAAERRTLDLFLTRYEVPMRESVEEAARVGLGELFAETRVVEGPAEGATFDPAGEVLASISVSYLEVKGGLFSGDDTVTVELEASFDNGKGGPPLTHKASGRWGELSTITGAPEWADAAFGHALVEALDEVNEYVDRHRDYFADP